MLCDIQVTKEASLYRHACRRCGWTRCFPTERPIAVPCSLPLPQVPAAADEVARREQICRACRYWDTDLLGCHLLQKCERQLLTRALWSRAESRCHTGAWDRNPDATAYRAVTGCPACDAVDPLWEPVPSIRAAEWAFQHDVRDRYAAALQDVLAAEPPKPVLSGDGIVYCGEGKYWAGIVIGVRLLRELGCTLPVQVWSNADVGHELDDDPYTRRIDIRQHRRQHPARHCTGYASKSYAMVHCGFRRALWLDADAYCVADPTPLFAALDENPLVVWSTRREYPPTVPAVWSGIEEPNVAAEFQGGMYLIDLERCWREMLAVRWVDNHADYWWTHNKYHDEGSWRMIVTALKPAFTKLNYQGRDGVMICDWRNKIYICHRIRAKLYLGTVPRRNYSLPMEGRVFELFAALSPQYKQQVLEPQPGRNLAKLRAARQQQLRQLKQSRRS